MTTESCVESLAEHPLGDVEGEDAVASHTMPEESTYSTLDADARQHDTLQLVEGVNEVSEPEPQGTADAVEPVIVDPVTREVTDQQAKPYHDHQSMGSIHGMATTEAEWYRLKIMAIYEEHNQSKLGELDSILAKYAGKERHLYEAVCKKYLGSMQEDVPADLRGTSAAFGLSSWFQQPALGESFSTSSSGFLQSGWSTLQTMKGAAEVLQTAAEGYRDKVERSFDEAIRAEEDTSALELVQKATIGNTDAQRLLTSGIGKLQGAAEGLRDKVERSFDEAIRTEEDTAEGREKAQVLAAEAKASKMAERAAGSEAVVHEQRGEIRRLTLEVDRLRAQMQREQKDHAAELKRLQFQHSAELDRMAAHMQKEIHNHSAEQEARKSKSLEHDTRLRVLEDKLEAASRERGELIATNQAISADHQRSIVALDSAERMMEEQKMQAEKALEEQRKRLEAVEFEFAQQSLPYTRQIMALEQKLAAQEQRMAESEAAVQRSLAASEEKEAALEKELRIKAERESQQKEEEAQRRASARKEIETLQREVSETRALAEAAQKDRETCERKREELDAQFKLEANRRRTEEKRSTELADKVADLTRQLKQARAVTSVTADASGTGGTPANNLAAVLPSTAPGSSPTANGGQASPSFAQLPREMEEDARRLRAEIQALTRQRTLLEREAARLQNHVDSVQQKAGSAGGNRRASNSTLLEQKFEAALQMIGRLNEELEDCRTQRDELAALAKPAA